MTPTPPWKVEFSRTLLVKMQQTQKLYRRLGLVWDEPPAIKRALEIMFPMHARFFPREGKPRYLHTNQELAAEFEYSRWLANQWRRAKGLPEVNIESWHDFKPDAGDRG